MAERKLTVFVIMPFAKEFNSGLQDIIKPAVEKAGMECIRADQEAQGPILKMMFERIFDSPLLIADISGANPNVFYELGVSHCVGRKTITMAREDFIDQVPFDIAPYRVFVYPKPPSEPCDKKEKENYHVRVGEAVKGLIKELERVAKEDEVGISNPVQDYVVSRSPLTCRESRYLDRFGGDLEEELLRHTREELVFVGLTGSHFVNILAGYIESGERKIPMKVSLLLLDPKDHEGWGYVYHLREGHSVAKDEFEKLIVQDRSTQQRVEQTITRLNRVSNFSGDVSYYSGIPLFWAYFVDRNRLIIGYLAMHRMGSLNLPVTVLVKDDPKTQILYSYYVSAINLLAKI